MTDYPKHTICMEKTGLDKECTWKVGDGLKNCPHPLEDRKPDHDRKIKNSIVDCVGNTPLVRT